MNQHNLELTEEQIQKVKEAWGDWEVVHGLYDEYIAERLRKLDPLFMESVDRVFKDATFWYASIRFLHPLLSPRNRRWGGRV